MKTLTIHDIKPNFFDGIDYGGIDYRKYNLTFDDGLFSQYFYWPIIRMVDTKKIFFISTNLIGFGDKRKTFKEGKLPKFPDCFEALADYRETGNRENYMRLEELQEIINDDAIIGAHGHDHIKFFDTFSQLKEDIEKMLEWFDKHLKITPTKFAFPHYVDIPILKQTLESYGFTEFYGKERIEIEQEKNIFSNV